MKTTEKDFGWRWNAWKSGCSELQHQFRRTSYRGFFYHQFDAYVIGADYIDLPPES